MPKGHYYRPAALQWRLPPFPPPDKVNAGLYLVKLKEQGNLPSMTICLEVVWVPVPGDEEKSVLSLKVGDESADYADPSALKKLLRQDIDMHFGPVRPPNGRGGVGVGTKTTNKGRE
jgi:hypothetical protein